MKKTILYFFLVVALVLINGCFPEDEDAYDISYEKGTTSDELTIEFYFDWAGTPLEGLCEERAKQMYGEGSKCNPQETWSAISKDLEELQLREVSGSNEVPVIFKEDIDCTPNFSTKKHKCVITVKSKGLIEEDEKYILFSNYGGGGKQKTPPLTMFVSEDGGDDEESAFGDAFDDSDDDDEDDPQTSGSGSQSGSSSTSGGSGGQGEPPGSQGGGQPAQGTVLDGSARPACSMNENFGYSHVALAFAAFFMLIFVGGCSLARAVLSGVKKEDRNM